MTHCYNLEEVEQILVSLVWDNFYESIHKSN